MLKKGTFWLILGYCGLFLTNLFAGAPCYDGLIDGCWHFDEGNLDVTFDAAPQRKQAGIGGEEWTRARLNGNATFVDGISGRAISLDGTKDSVHTGSSTIWDFSGTEPFTVACWIYLIGRQALQTIVSNSGGTGVGWIFTLGTGQGLPLQFTFNGVRDFAGTTTISSRTWHHIAFTWSGADGTIYLDGKVELASTGGSAPLATTLSTSILIGAINVARDWNGYIDDVLIYEKALSLREIENLYLSYFNREGYIEDE